VSSVQALFDHARSRVTPDDLRNNTPNDPGCLRYLAAWTDIVATGVMPPRGSFDVEEPIGLTQHIDDADASLRRYRVLLNSVVLPWLPDILISHPDLLARLIDDALALEDEILIARLSEALTDTHARLLTWEVAPFVSLAVLLLGPVDDAAIARRVIAEKRFWHAARDEDRWPSSPPKKFRERPRRAERDARFLLGLTPYDQSKHVWLRLIAERLTAPTGDVATLRGLLLG